MQIALDPYMHRHLSLSELCKATKEMGYDHIELSPRADFLQWWTRPRVYPERLNAFKKALKDHELTVSTLQPMYRWSSPFEDERKMAIDNWKRTIEIAVELDSPLLISEFGRGGSPERSLNDTLGIHSAEACEHAFWRSMDELVPILEREGLVLSIEPHPEDWVETMEPAIDIIRTINSTSVKASYIAPHTFYYGDDLAETIRMTQGELVHARVADTFNHKASSQLRYIVNPPGSTARVHQHLDMGEGEINWDTFFKTLSEIGFDGVLSSCVFAWEERAEDSSRFMRDEIQTYVDKYWK
ncbi:sugar phosphate isomerase/epimerase [Neptunomonas phycophila]|uniref:Sugar phosphate isomerase/epimerase n=1 Tax=Neptunomonas phycophila TaxID=1572645 RepID=A0AAW7XG76_9GAMM|nr:MULTISPECIES: sugar phosphate isomerase/epimerase [Neptunomonas]MBT3146287.1 sugar phosphate isomerase/epimerase [Neptunomonas phycophila]MDN2659537.1 sugar phosphate isomerase/epimerase [Neptunomonas sp. CHC150]MDO6452079.1 sugar phosphate isomerase/epimerase [Neptunomonas phycophila]MDO6466632.1 sugar phosphate isomerase/epimerase [Neptunomonas phycophila]MDO6783044.1 sugar phosphate isomerase/epimerase [Neptunomonas phycophila]